MSNTHYTKADRKPTWTSLIIQVMTAQDDFMSLPQIMAATGANGNQVRAILFHLKKSRVVDVIEAEGALWWFLTGDDARTKPVPERVREPKGNRTRVTNKGTKRTPKPKY